MEVRDPSTFEFTDEESRLIEEHVSRSSETFADPETNLDRDQVTVPHQNFAVISIVSDSTKTRSCLKLRGAFETLEGAREHARNISERDNSYDVLVVSMYEWLLVPPPYDSINDQVYIDEQLNTIITEYKASQEKCKKQFEMRKDALKKG